MKAFLLLCLLILLTSLLHGLSPATGFVWDYANAIGFCTLAGLVYLGWEAESPAQSPQVRLHSNMSLLTACLLTIHIMLFVITDPIVIEYLKLKAPLYMLAGALSALVVYFLTITSFPGARLQVFKHFRLFKKWHLALSCSALLLGTWHVCGSFYYLDSRLKQILFLTVALGAPLLAYGLRLSSLNSLVTARVKSIQHADTVAVICLCGVLVLCTLYAWVKNV